MSQHEAQEYVDLIIEKLHDSGVIPDGNYGRMTESQREALADAVRQKSEE